MGIVFAKGLDKRPGMGIIEGFSGDIVISQHLGHVRAKTLVEHEHVSHADDHLLDIFHNVSFVMLAGTTQALP